jgi:N-acetylmuramoyl-L-alanine amidase
MKKKTAYLAIGLSFMFVMLAVIYRGGAVVAGISVGISVAEPVEVIPVTSLLFSEREMDILHRIAWAEARGEDDKGLVLVINVIMNRIESPRFPDCVESVVFEPRQFCPVRNGAFDRATPCERIERLVYEALRGRDYSQGALYFRTIRGAEGSWHERDRTALFDHGVHRFYR